MIGIVFNHACDRNVNEITYQFLIENRSGSEINIAVFESISNTFVRNIPIEQGGVVSWKITSSERDATPNIQHYFQGDSVAITFGNGERIINYKCQVSIQSEECDVNGNILNSVYSKWKLDILGDFKRRTYVFTEKEYEDAKPCNGGC